MQMPQDVIYIINELYDNGYEAFAVGGCVRDCLLGKTPHDWDITTDASPQQVKNIFKKTVDTGIEHGTVSVILNSVGYEVTTYRIDGEYLDNRHPKEVIFTSNLKEDLMRRDFTINAMAYNDIVGLVDIYGGREDLQKGIIRCVGNAHDRFSEDALRILRAIRFSAQLGFEIDEETKNAMSELASNLKNVSAERIKTELDKMLLSDNCDRFILMSKLGICKVILPEFDAMLETTQENINHIYDVGRHTLVATEYVDKRYEKDDSNMAQFDECMDFSILDDEKVRLMLKWTMLLHDTGKPVMKTIDEKGVAHFKGHPEKSVEIAKRVFERLKFDNYTANTACHLIRWHDYRFENDIRAVRRALSKVGQEYAQLLFLVQRADILGQNPTTFSEKFKKQKDALINYEEIVKSSQCLSVKDLKIGGRELIAAGIAPGPMMGEILNSLLESVIEDPGLNNEEDLIQIAKRITGII